MIKWFENLNSKEYVFDLRTKNCVYVLIFLIGAVVGFIYEEIFYFVFDHELVKRGFLYGPYLPVYGFGAVAMVFLLKRFKKDPLVVFLLAMLVTGVLEYFTGFLLWEVYDKIWWDYSGLFLNIGGYVCLRSVLTFAVGGLLLIYIIEPLVYKLVSIAKGKMLFMWSQVICFMFVIDFIFTMIFRNTL